MTLQRNMGHIDTLLDELGVGSLKNKSLRRLWILREFLRQQLEWFETGQSPPSRIVSLAQPHIRPIFRGKANASYEFGAKVSLSVENGFVMLHASRFENFNESGDLIEQIREYLRRKGHSPASVHADQIYRTRKNREFCKRHGIRLSGPPLGRPPKDEVCKKNDKPRQNRILGNAISWKERSDKLNGVSRLPVSSPDSHTPAKLRSPSFSWSSTSKKLWLWAWGLFIFCSFCSSASSRTGKSF